MMPVNILEIYKIMPIDFWDICKMPVDSLKNY